MKKKILTILALVMAVGGMAFSTFNVATMDDGVAVATAKDTDTDDTKCTSILPNSWCSDKEGDAVFKILNLVLYVITAGVGVLGMVGIVVAGVQYATAGDNDAQVVAAKGRIKNIVIGLVLWVALFALIQWLTIGKVG